MPCHAPTQVLPQPRGDGSRPRHSRARPSHPLCPPPIAAAGRTTSTRRMFILCHLLPASSCLPSPCQLLTENKPHAHLHTHLSFLPWLYLQVSPGPSVSSARHPPAWNHLEPSKTSRGSGRPPHRGSATPPSPLQAGRQPFRPARPQQLLHQEPMAAQGWTQGKEVALAMDMNWPKWWIQLALPKQDTVICKVKVLFF